MKYEQCTTVELIYEYPGQPATQRIPCVMFKGHKPLSVGDDYMPHNFGGLGPFTPGMDPAEYVRLGNTMVPWWRRLIMRKKCAKLSEKT